MKRTSRAMSFLVLLPVWLAACGNESGELPSGSLDAAVARCDVEVAEAVIGEIFPDRGLRNQARHQCQNILRSALGGDVADATEKTFAFLEQTLGFRDQGILADPSQGTLEEAIAELFGSLFAAIGVEGPPLGEDIVVEKVDETGGTVTAPSGHAAVRVPPGHVEGETWVTISRIPDPDPNTVGDCPFGFPVPYDCYPQFYDVSFHPDPGTTSTGGLATAQEEAVVVGQCVVEPPDPNAPPSATVEGRLRLASPDHQAPGELVFWPLAEAPGTVNCDDLAFGPPPELRDALWTGLGPLQWLFRVNSAYANPGRLGASVSSFSPIAPTDPGVPPESPYVFRSTNDANRAGGFPHVDAVDAGGGEVTLRFVNDTRSLALFEYRIDGRFLVTGDPHPVVINDFVYPTVCVDGRAAPICGNGDPEVVTFQATDRVEVRLALGGERNWDFDWTTFEVDP